MSSSIQMKEERHPLIFVNNGEKIFATLHTPLNIQNPPIVALLHGFASHKVGTNRAYVRLAEGLSNVGVAVLRFDMRGCGDSEGCLSRMSVEDFISDFKTVADFLKDYERVGLFGSSFGGAMAIYGASFVKNLKSIVLWAPVASGKLWHDDWVAVHKGPPSQEALLAYTDVEINPLFREQFTELHAANELEKWGAIPLLHLHGDADETISLNHQKAYREHRQGAKSKSRFIIYPGTRHAFGLARNFSAIEREIITWYQETL